MKAFPALLTPTAESKLIGGKPANTYRPKFDTITIASLKQEATIFTLPSKRITEDTVEHWK